MRDQGVALNPYSPLTRGRLTRPWDETTGRRSQTDAVQRERYLDSSLKAVVDAVSAVAAERGVPSAQVALAWLLARPGVVSPMIGATKPQHLADAIAAIEIKLSDSEIAQLEAPYRPQAISGH